MAETGLQPLSPLEGLTRAGRHGHATPEPAVTLSERASASMATIVARRGRDADIVSAIQTAFGIVVPTRPIRCEAAGIAVAWAGPGQWLAIGYEERARDLSDDFVRLLAGLAAVTDQGDGRSIVGVQGPGAREALAKLMPIDLHPRVFTPGDTALTMAGHIAVQIWQLDASPNYEIVVARSYARSFWRAITDACVPLGYAVRA